MKRICAYISVILIIIILPGCSNKADSLFTFISKEDGSYRVYELLDRDSAVIIIPDKYKLKKVTEVSEYSFYRNENIEKVIISDNIVAIKDYAFAECYNLSSIHIGKNTKILSGTAFVDVNLSEITISPDNPYFIVKNNCLLEKGTGRLIVGTNNSIIPEGTTEIAMHAFVGRCNLVSVVVPEGCKKIGYAAFTFCDSLANVVLPESLEVLDRGAFGFCRSLKTVNIPSGVTRLEEGVFHACLDLGSFRIPDTVQEIGEGAFQYSILTDVYIPESVIIIESDAFDTPVQDVTIYCEAHQKPPGWADDWTSSNNIIIWGYGK